MWDEHKLTADSLMVRALADHLEAALADAESWKGLAQLAMGPNFELVEGETYEQVGWGHYFGRDSESQWQFVNDSSETPLYRKVR